RRIASFTRHTGTDRRRFTQDGRIRLLRLSGWIDTKLPPQDIYAGLVLPQGGGAPALAHIQSHERPVCGLMERVEREEVRGGQHRLFQRTSAGLPGKKLRKAIDRQ